MELSQIVTFLTPVLDGAFGDKFGGTPRLLEWRRRHVDGSPEVRRFDDLSIRSDEASNSVQPKGPDGLPLVAERDERPVRRTC